MKAIDYLIELPNNQWLKKMNNHTAPVVMDVEPNIGWENKHEAECWASQVDGKVVEHEYEYFPLFF